MEGKQFPEIPRVLADRDEVPARSLLSRTMEARHLMPQPRSPEGQAFCPVLLQSLQALLLIPVISPVVPWPTLSSISTPHLMQVAGGRLPGSLHSPCTS